MRRVRVVTVRNATRGTVLAERAGVADRFWLRLRGLLGRRNLAPGEGLVIRPTAAVHTFLMGFHIDVVHVDRGGRVLKVRERLGRGRTSTARGGFAVVELPAGTVAATGTQVGDQLHFEEPAPGG
ncbi:MAG TPA: DUF192 domain-containing protein [Bacillota bacterium]